MRNSLLKIDLLFSFLHIDRCLCLFWPSGQVYIGINEKRKSSSSTSTHREKRNEIKEFEHRRLMNKRWTKTSFWMNIVRLVKMNKKKSKNVSTDQSWNNLNRNERHRHTFVHFSFSSLFFPSVGFSSEQKNFILLVGYFVDSRRDWRPITDVELIFSRNKSDRRQVQTFFGKNSDWFPVNIQTAKLFCSVCERMN